MVEKGLGRESDEVIIDVDTTAYFVEGLKRFIVQIVIIKIVHEPEIEWAERIGT